ncbi:MAG: PIN domain-containing protein [Acidobacteria bacterium]|nr:PIN domain-containing protein [Acidobacteriota bacterium]
MKSLDTNVILRFLLRDVRGQTARAVAAVTAQDVYVTDVVITETAFVLEKYYEAPRNTITKTMRAFLALPNLSSNASLFSDVFELYEARQSLSIIDCYAAVEAGVWQNSLVTFDKKLLKYGGAHVSEP